MKIDTVKFAKTVSKTLFYIISRAAGFAVIGLVLNLLFLAVLSPEMQILHDKIGPVRIDSSNSALAFKGLVLFVVAYWPTTLMIFVFPVLYFFFGKKYGIQKAIQYVMLICTINVAMSLHN